MDSTLLLNAKGGAEQGTLLDADDTTLYRSLVGQLVHISRVTRPDIAHAVGKVSRFNQEPRTSHLTAVKDIIRYLICTKRWELQLGGCTRDMHGSIPSKGLRIEGFADSDYASDPDRRRSCTGYVLKVGGSSISWMSKLQATPALSTTESEYMAMCAAARESQYLRSMLAEIGIGANGPTLLWGDNQGAIALVKNPAHHERTKHIDVQYHYIRALTEQGVLQLTTSRPTI